MGFDTMWSFQHLRLESLFTDDIMSHEKNDRERGDARKRRGAIWHLRETSDRRLECQKIMPGMSKHHRPAIPKIIPAFQRAKAGWSPPPSPNSCSPSPNSCSPSPNSCSPLASPSTHPWARSLQSLPTPPASPVFTVGERRVLADKLFAASCAGDTTTMIELIDAGAPVNSSTVVPKLFEVFKPAKQGHLSPLAGAASNGQLDAVELLLAHGAVLNPSTTESASSPLHEACRKNDMDIVRQLLECGANVNSCNRYNLTPVMYAAKYSSPELLDLILSYHPDLEKLSFINTSVTHWSIWRGDAGMTEQIIKAGAGLHHRSLSGDTPLHFAVLSGSLEIISILLKYGADPYGLNGERKTPIDLAREHESWEILKLFHTQTSSR